MNRKIFRGLVCGFVLITTTISGFAIEGLKLSLQCSNVVLSWPSVEDETYMVQYRQSLETNSPWIWLTNALAAEVGTNLTFFVHSNVVQYANCGGGAGSFAAVGGDESEIEVTSAFPSMPMAIPADGSGDAVPLLLYPPGFDLSNFLILDPLSAEWVNGFEYSSFDSSGGVSSDGPPSPGDPQEGGSITNATPETGFYRVVRTGMHLFGVTNGTVLSGKVTLPVEIGFDDGIEFDGFFVMVGDTNQTLPANGLEFQGVTNGLPRFVLWDTRQVTNGTYQIFLGSQWGETQIYESPPVTVIVSNVIWFPDSWNVAGRYINVEAQSVHTNGTYEVEIFDDTGFQILQASGTNDSEGFITYAGFRGFVVENFDQNGEWG